MNKKIRQNRYKPAPKDKKTRRVVADRNTVINAGLLVAFMIIAGLGSIYIHDFFTQSDFFKIREITISGNKMAHREELLELTDVKPEDNLYAINLFTITRQLNRHPWVHSVTVKRNPPDTLLISVTEEEALAVVVLPASEKILINKTGIPFKEYVLDQDNHLNLPVITGLQFEQQESAHGFDGQVFDSVMDLLTTPVDIKIRTVSADINTGLAIEVPDEFNPHEVPHETTIRLKLGFGNYAEKITRARKLSVYMQQHFAHKRICSMDLFDMEKIFVKIQDDENALHNNLKKGV